MLTQTVKPKRIVMVRLSTGDDILARLKEAVRKEGVKNASIVAGVGSVSSYHYHVISTRTNPPEEAYPKGDYPLDILNVNGLIIDGRVHAHITFSDNKVALGGHLEPGCIVQTFSVIIIHEFDDADFTDWDQIVEM